MTRKIMKRNITKRKKNTKKTKKVNKKNSTKKVWFGGESLTAEKQQQKNS